MENTLSLPLLQAAEGMGGQNPLFMLLTFGAVFAIMYFMIIRPQNQRQKKVKEMLATIKKGDRVVSIGGIHGTVDNVKDDTVILDIGKGNTIEFNKSAIATVLDAEGKPLISENEKA